MTKVMLAIFALTLASTAAYAGGDAAAGRTLFTARGCIGCHGARGEGLGSSFPKLAGLTAAEVETRLKKYRAGETLGPKTEIMAPNARSLSDAEIADLAAFVAGL